MMSRIVINGSVSAACRSVNFQCSIYDLSKYDTSLFLLSKLKDKDEECAIQHASTIVDFLHYCNKGAWGGSLCLSQSTFSPSGNASPGMNSPSLYFFT